MARSDRDYRPGGVDWTGEVKAILKAELSRRRMTYNHLVQALHEMGIYESEANLRNKLSRGSFTAVFFVQCLTAMGADSVRLKL